MQFGTRNADAPKSSGQRQAISWFGKNDTRIRFMEEMDDWTKIQQHFSASARTSYPCTGDEDTCPGCQSDDEREANTQTRFITNAVDTERGYVNLYAVPYSTYSQFERAEEKDGGTIRARDYTVVQFKEDKRTSYTVEREEKEKFDFSKYESKMKDHQEALNTQFQSVWGDKDEPTEALSRPSKKSQDEAERMIKQAKEQKAPKDSMESQWHGKDEDPPSEPPQEKDAEEEITMTEDEIRGMNLPQLVKLYEQCGIEVPSEDMNASQLADHLITSLTE